MKYHTVVNREELAAGFPQIGRWGESIMIEVDETQVGAFYAACRELTGKTEGFLLVGKDRRGYWAMPDGTAKYISKYAKGSYSPEEWERSAHKLDRRTAAEARKREAMRTKTGCGEKWERGSLLRYKPGAYLDASGEIRFSYRVRYAKSPGQPLLVCFHGGGGEGSDNIKQLHGWKKNHIERFLRGKDYTLLLPQFPQTGGEYSISGYLTAVRELCGRIAADAKTDAGRIYCMGGSFGGQCTWLSACLFPDFYACAMPMMGAFTLEALPEPLRPEAYSRLKDLPIWVSHSADDATVPITRDDETVAVLRELGAPVKYTRVDGYGHHYLVPYFLKNEPWAEWMFARKKALPGEAHGGAVQERR